MHEASLKITAHTKIKAFPLVSSRAGDKTIYLGSPKIGPYLTLNIHWQPLVKLLKTPQTPRTIHQHLAKTDPKHFSKKSGLNKTTKLLNTMQSHGLLSWVGHHKIAQQSNLKFKKAQHSRIELIWWLPLIMITVLLAFLALWIPLTLPQTRPAFHHFFWHPQLSTTYGVSLLITIVMGSLHELVHWLTALFFGVKGSINISSRLNFVVFITKLPNIYALEPWKRILIYLNGPLFDLVIIGLTNTFLINRLTQGLPDQIWVDGLIRQFLLIMWLGFWWQFLFFLKTDLYFVLREIFQKPNLHQKATNLLNYLNKNSQLPKESFAVYAYATLMVIGTIPLVIRFLLFNLPITLNILFSGTSQAITALASQNWTSLVDNLVVILVKLTMLSTLIYSHFRKKTLPE